MRKGGSFFALNIAVFQIFLVVLSTIAFSFIFSSGFVSAQGSEVPEELLVRNLAGQPNVAPPITQIPAGSSTYAEAGAQLASDAAAEEAVVAGAGSVAAKASAASTQTITSTAPGGIYAKAGLTGGYAHLAQGIVWAAVAYGAGQLIGSLLGLEEGTTKTLSLSLATGAAAFKFLDFASSAESSSSVFNFAGSQSILGACPLCTAVVVAAAVFVLTYKKETVKMVTFSCLPFEPAIGGAKCEECNKDLFRPCSEYRCRSLGQACQLLNKGTKEESCAWVSRGDVNSPVIDPWEQALKPANLGLRYIPDNAIRPPNRGVKIISNTPSQCVPAFTALEFGLTLNEPAQCKLDFFRSNATGKPGFDAMQFYFGESNYFRYNHTQKMKLPGPGLGTDLSPILRNDGFTNLYVKCIDANGNVNEDDFLFSFCVDQGPDTTPPIIEATSIVSGSHVQYNADNVPIEVYVNEPAECKWSRINKDYIDMENTMQCATETFQINSLLSYTCSGNLTGIKNNEDNKFYFRCRDKPDAPENERNTMSQSYELILKGSQPLNILSAGPTGRIIGSTDVVPITLEVKTDDGADEGKAICYFSPTGAVDSYIAMFETNSFISRQTLDLTAGSYNYAFRCIDAGGNSAEANATFSVFVDKQSPRITRVYRDTTDSLKVITDENSTCKYSLNSCNFIFEEGINLLYPDSLIRTQSFVEWKPNTPYYIKCRDDFGNEPSPNACSIAVSATQFS